MHNEDTGPQFSHFGMFVTDLEKVAGFSRDKLDFIETDHGSVGDRQIIFLSRDPREHHQLAFVSAAGSRLIAAKDRCDTAPGASKLAFVAGPTRPGGSLADPPRRDVPDWRRAADASAGARR